MKGGMVCEERNEVKEENFERGRAERKREKEGTGKEA